MKYDWRTFKNILCVRPDAMGDVIMTSPAFRALKEQNPKRKLTLLTSKTGKAIAKFIPEVDEILEYNVPWESAAVEKNQRDDFYKIIDIIKKNNFDAAIIFTTYSQNPFPSALICYLAKIPHILGYAHETATVLMPEWIPDSEPFYGMRHETRRQLDLVAEIGAHVIDDRLKLTIDKTAKTNMFHKLQFIGVDVEKPWILLHAGARETRRQFPVPTYAEAAQKLIKLGYQIVLSGVAAEKEIVQSLQEQIGMGAYCLAGRLDLGEMIALVSEAPYMISNNTGPIHIASAVGTPVVVLYATTNPQHLPWKVPYRILLYDIPQVMRSKNIILKYASQKYFKPVSMPTADDIVQAVSDLQSNKYDTYKIIDMK